MVNFLGIDTSTGPCSAAVWKNGNIAAYLEDKGKATQSACLMPMIEKALRASGLAYKDLGAVVCTVGPGSFTGIRVGLSAARGIQLAAGIKGMGFTTLEVLAFTARKSPVPILASLQAGKGEVYYQGFDTVPQWRPRFAAQIGTPSEALASMPDNVMLVGNTGDTAAFPRADALCELAATRTAQAQPLEPFYIRLPDAKPMADVG